jgi:hypothetical protein
MAGNINFIKTEVPGTIRIRNLSGFKDVFLSNDNDMSARIVIDNNRSELSLIDDVS